METRCFKYQKNYVDNLMKIGIDIDRRKNPTLPLTTSKKEVLQSKIGHLLWLCNQTCPLIWHVTLTEPPLMN